MKIKLLLTLLIIPVFSYCQFQTDILTRYNNIVDSHVEDLDGNGYLDIVAVTSDGTLSYWLNNSSGFSNEVIVDETFLSLKSIDVIDLDGDLDLDFLIGENNSVSAYYNDGNGNYTSDYINGNALHSNAIAGDFNGDGLMDFITSSSATNGQLQYFKKHFSGLFFDIFPIAAAPAQTDDMIIDDFDNDGDLDIIVAIESGFWSNDHVLIYYNDGAGNFTQFNTGFSTPAKNPQIIDYNNDGLKDIFISRAFCCSGVLVQDNNGNFAYTELTNESGMEKSYYTDADGDGDYDIIYIFGGRNANIFTGTPYIPPSIGVWENNNGVYAGYAVDFIDGGKLISSYDFNNDNINDWLVTGDFAFGPRIYTRTGVSTYALTSLKESFTSNIKDTRDFNNDGYIDLLTVSTLHKTIKLLTSDTIGGLISETLVNDIEDLDEARFSDIDNDGDLDVIFNSTAASSVPGTGIYKLVNNGSSGFQQTLISSNFMSELLIGDVDGDNDDDIIALSTTSGDVNFRVYNNDGSGNFASANLLLLVPDGTMSHSGSEQLIAFKDLDLDGIKDIDIGVEYYLKGDGNGNFNAIQLPAKGKLVDFDLDGDFDIVYSNLNATSWTLSWFENNAGLFVENIIDPNYRGPKISVKDFDGDGDLDIISLSNSDFLSDGVRIWTNDGLMNFTSSNINNSLLSGNLFEVDYDGDLDWDVIISDGRIGFHYLKNNSNIPVLNLSSISENYLVYPNPTEGIINLNSKRDFSNYKLYNLSGQLIKSDDISKNQLQSIDINSIPKGVYLIQLFGENGEINTLKIIKE